MARASSASDLPTPVKTISAGVKPARSATSISPPELASAAVPSARSSRAMRQRGVGLQRVVQRVRIAGERLVDLAVTGRDHRGAVGVERGAEAGGKVGERHAVAVQRTLQPLK